MNTGAGVRSLEALKDWYSAVVEFRGEAHNAMVSLGLSLQHATNFLQEQQANWQRAIRRAEDEVSHARIELVRLQQQRFYGEMPDTTVAEIELRKAQAELQFCEERLEAVRRWMQKLPQVILDIYEGPARNLEYFLDSDLVRAIALLDRQLVALEEYLGLKPPTRSAPAPASPPAETPEKKETP
jgi:hypothetical protein